VLSSKGHVGSENNVVLEQIISADVVLLATVVDEDG
jgi:fructose-specific phosphotransferase system component IIB